MAERSIQVKNKISKAKVNYRKHERRELARALRRELKREVREHHANKD